MNPPGNPKARFALGPALGSAHEWESVTEERPGSWWEGWTEWVAKTSPCDDTAAPSKLGSTGHPPLDAAPGRYVRDLEVSTA